MYIKIIMINYYNLMTYSPYYCFKYLEDINILIYLLYNSNNFSKIQTYNKCYLNKELIEKKYLITKDIDRKYINRYLRVYNKDYIINDPIGLITNKHNIGSLNYNIKNKNLTILYIYTIKNNYKLLLSFIYFCINIAKNKEIKNLIFDININIDIYFLLLKTFELLINKIKYYNDNFILFNAIYFI